MDPGIANRNLDQLKSTPRGAVVLRNLHGTLRERHFAKAPNLRQAVLTAFETILKIDQPAWSAEDLALSAAAHLNAAGAKRAGPPCYEPGKRDNSGFAHTMHHSKATEQPNPIINDHGGAVSPDELADLPPPELRKGAVLGRQYGIWWFTHYDEVFDRAGNLRTGVDLLEHLGFPVEGRNGVFVLITGRQGNAVLTQEARRPTVLDGAHHPRLKVKNIDPHKDHYFGWSADLRPLSNKPPTIIDGVVEAVAPPLPLDGILIDLCRFHSQDMRDPKLEDSEFSGALDAILHIDVVVSELKHDVGLP